MIVLEKRVRRHESKELSEVSYEMLVTTNRMAVHNTILLHWGCPVAYPYADHFQLQ